MRGDKNRTHHHTRNFAAFARAVAGANDGVIIAGSSGTLLYANNKAAKIFGFPSAKGLLGEQAIRHDTVELRIYPGNTVLPPDDWPLAHVRRTGEPVSLEASAHQLQHKHRTSIYHFEATPGHIYDTDVVILKISPPHLFHPANKHFLSSETVYRIMQHNSFDIISLVDTNGKLKYLSPSMQKPTGYKPEELIGKRAADIVHPDDLAKVQHTLRSVIRHGHQHSPIHYRIQRKDGSWMWVESIAYNMCDDPAVNSIVTHYRDITEQKQVEEELKEKEQAWRFLADSLPQKIFAATPDGQIYYYNQDWLDYTGLSQEELSGKISDLIHPDDRAEDLRRWQYAFQTGHPYNMELRIRGRDGTYHWHLNRARPMRDDNGKITMWVGSDTDIQDYKQKRELEKHAASLALQREKLLAINEAKDEFISLASHQLRTPATAVKQYVGMLLEGYTGELTSEQLSMAALAYQSNERQLKIINALLHVARLDAGNIPLQRKKIKLTGLIAELADEQRELLSSRRQHLATSLPKKPVLYCADAALLRTALENLLDNASKYSKPATTVTLTLCQTAQSVKLSVSDEGAGIAKQDLGKLFKKFSRLDNEDSIRSGGSGLGLYWAKKIAELHGAKITVNSKPKKGTTFTIVLPRIPKSITPSEKIT
jgi:PAS domain S-box-containing protein